MGKFTLLLSAAVVMAQIAADPYAGVFAGPELRLELRASGPGAYTGAIQVQGQTFPVSARTANQQLTGTFTSGANRFQFQAAPQNGQLRLVSDGHEYLLTRESPAASAHSHPKGFTVRPAANWTAQNNEQGVLLIPAGGASQGEVYVAALQDGYSAAEEAKSVQLLSQGFLQSGGQIRRAGERESLGNGTAYYWEIVDPKTRAVAGLKIYFTPAGTRAHVIVAFGLADRIVTRDADLRQMLSSMQAAAPQTVAVTVGPLADNSPAAQQWLRKLQGKMIRQFHAYQGMSSDKRHMLNADGSYWFRSNSMVAIDVPGASASSTGGNNSRGRWRIRDANGEIFLQVQYTSGETRQFRITQDARNWYLNGEKAFAVDPE